MRRFHIHAILGLGLMMLVPAARAQDFDTYFDDRTLRIDYSFAGNARSQSIYVSELLQSPGWAGRRHHLDELPLDGNGDITMRDKQTGTVIYRTSFSTLFQEWQGQEEATRTDRAFENTFLLPFPKAPAEVTIELRDYHHRTTAALTHTVDPTDILIRHLPKSEAPVRELHHGGTSRECIDVAIVAEGYTADEMETFYRDAQAACRAILAHAPFDRLAGRFNFIAVGAPSEDSGVSVPREGMWRRTAVGSNFDTFYSDRYLTTGHVRRLNDLLAGLPYEHIIVLANTETYGGGGIYNFYTLTAAHHAQFAPVVVHEFGHSFGGLADEYFYDDQYTPMYPSDTEPWEPNLTTLKDFSSKWADMLPEGTPVPTPPVTDPARVYTQVGVYEGGGYSSKGVYRPATECRMKINEAPAFCPVCQRALERLIRFYTEE